MTIEELRIEWKYRYVERLGILCETNKPTPEQIEIARKEADEAINQLKGETQSLTA